MSDESPNPIMWYDKLPDEKSWGRLWSDYTICGRCRAIRMFQGPCAVCGDPPFSMEPHLVRDEHGQEFATRHHTEIEPPPAGPSILSRPAGNAKGIR